MNKGVLLIICIISSVVWDRTDAICGGSDGVVVPCRLSPLDLTGDGVDTEAAVGCIRGTGADFGEGLRICNSSKSSGSSST